jgi:hypothetical protein
MKNYVERTASIVAAILLAQTLYFKFTAAPESVFIFTKLGLEPYGRIGIGIVELFVAILLFIRRTSLIGAVLGIGVISGAIFSHLFVIGIEVQKDSGLLFGLAILVLILCLITVFSQKEKIGFSQKY